MIGASREELDGAHRRAAARRFAHDNVLYGAVGRIVNAPRSHIYAEAALEGAPAAGDAAGRGLGWRRDTIDRLTYLDIAAPGRPASLGVRGRHAF